MSPELEKIARVLTPLVLELFEKGEDELMGYQIVGGLPYLNPDWVWLLLGILLANGELVVVDGYKPRVDVREQIWRRSKREVQTL
jgi:hypothetical protein